MAEKGFPVEVVTPNRVVYAGEVSSLRAPGVEGDFEVLIGHIPFLTALRVGRLTIREGGHQVHYAVSGGFVEVLRHRVTVIAESAERAQEIDVERAHQAEMRARQRLAGRAAHVDLVRAQASLSRALNRLKVAGQM